EVAAAQETALARLTSHTDGAQGSFMVSTLAMFAQPGLRRGNGNNFPVVSFTFCGKA
ncbi:unnamed protein product, partial [Durusdinium trenchii]